MDKSIVARFCGPPCILLSTCTEARFDSSPTWLYVVSGITFSCIIIAAIIVLVCR